MNLDAILDNPATAWMAMERHLNDGSPSGVTTTTSTSTSPTGPDPHFELPFYQCPYSTIGDRPADLERHRPAGFPVHPDLDPRTDVGLDDPELVATIPVIPTASGRTVALADAPDQLHLKLHYPKTLGRFTRRLDQPRATAAIDTSALLNDHRTQLSPAVGFLAEPTGLIAPSGSAAIIRRGTPRPNTSSPEPAIIPLFSLWATDTTRPTDRPLLPQLLTASTDSPTDTVYHRLLEPIVDGWLELGLTLGLWCEWNAQNLLVTIDTNGQIQRVIFRDLQGIHRDPQRRPNWAPHLPTDSYRTFGRDPDADRRQRSWLFDFKLGEYVLDPLLANPLIVDHRPHLTEAIRARVDHRTAGLKLFPPGPTTWGQPPGQLVDGRWITERNSPPRYRTPASNP